MARFIALAVALVTAQSLSSSSQQTPDAAALQTAIGKLGDFDHAARTDAARTVRRAPAETVIPLLSAAARTHNDEYVRYRALTLLSGFGGSAVSAVMNDLRGDRNDRIRMVVYAWFEHNPDPAVLPSLIEAFGKERSEFVRPALTRALAAQSKDPRARAVLAPLVMKGADFFRGAVIEALGEYGATFAVADIAEVAAINGPLQDDAITALGRLGDASQVSVLAQLQRKAPETVQPTLAASLCLLGRACPETEKYLRDTLAFAARNEGQLPLLRGAVHAQAMLAGRSGKGAAGALFDAGVAAKSESVRSTIALGLGTVALRHPELILSTLEARTDVDAAIALLEEAFDTLAEDFEEERFFVTVRRAYWAAPADSAARRVAEALITRLGF